MSWLSSLGQTFGAGLVGAGAGFLIGGPVGAMAGFGIGMVGSASGMMGSTGGGALGGAAIGGLAGFAIGGPVGMLAGGLLGGLFGGAVASGFNQQPQQPPYAQGFPGQGFGGFPGMGFPGMGFPGGGFGFPQGGMGFGGFSGSFGGQPSINIYNFYGQGQDQCYGQEQCCCPQYPPQQQPPQQNGGQLKQDPNGGPIHYTTHGGYQVTVNGDNVSVVDPSGKHTVTQSGDPHEYVDGKHVKDWDAKTRTLILGDGTRMTMNATSANGTIQNTTIYDGAEEVKIKNSGNQIEGVSFNPYQTQADAKNQVQGETAFLGNRQDGSFTYKDIYNQADDGSISRYQKDIWSEPRRFTGEYAQQDTWRFVQA